jgi:hypothetical protein
MIAALITPARFARYGVNKGVTQVDSGSRGGNCGGNHVS